MAPNAAEYPSPAMALGSLAVVMDRGAGVTVIESVAVAVTGVGDVLSDTLTANVKVPIARGVPVMPPLAERLNPAGEGSEEYPGVRGRAPRGSQRGGIRRALRRHGQGGHRDRQRRR